MKQANARIDEMLSSAIENDLDKTEEKNEANSPRIKALAKFQKEALTHALEFPNLKRIVYSTCSVKSSHIFLAFFVMLYSQNPFLGSDFSFMSLVNLMLPTYLGKKFQITIQIPSTQKFLLMNIGKINSSEHLMSRFQIDLTGKKVKTCSFGELQLLANSTSLSRQQLLIKGLMNKMFSTRVRLVLRQREFSRLISLFLQGPAMI